MAVEPSDTDCYSSCLAITSSRPMRNWRHQSSRAGTNTT